MNEEKFQKNLVKQSNLLNFWCIEGFFCEQTFISPLNFLSSLRHPLGVGILQWSSFSGGPETFSHVSLLAFFVETEQLYWVLNCYLNSFYIKTIDLVFHFLQQKQVYIYLI